MKKILLSIFALTATVVSACQYIETFNEDWRSIYISSVNWKYFHVKPIENNNVVISNNAVVDLPISVQIKVNDFIRFKWYTAKIEENGEEKHVTNTEYLGTYSATYATLYYAVYREAEVSGGKTHITIKPPVKVKSLNNLDWNMKFEKPVELFGHGGIIDIPDSQLKAGDIILIWIEVGSGIYTNNLDANWMYEYNGDSDFGGIGFYGFDYDPVVTNLNSELHPLQPILQWSKGVSFYLHIFKVIYSGKRRVII